MSFITLRKASRGFRGGGAGDGIDRVLYVKNVELEVNVPQINLEIEVPQIELEVTTEEIELEND